MDTRKKLGILFFVFSIVVCLVNLVIYLMDLESKSLLNIITPAIASLILLFTIFVNKPVSEWIQVCLISIIGIIIAILGTSSQQFLSALIFIVSFGMLYNYKLIQINLTVILITIIVVFTSFLIGCIIEENPYRAINMFAIFLAFTLASHWLFGYEIRRLSLENKQMNEISKMHESSAQITHLLKAKTSALQALVDSDLSNEQFLSLLKGTVDDVQETVGQIMTYARSSVKKESELVNVGKMIDAICLMVEHMPSVRGRIQFEKNINSLQPIKVVPSEFKAAVQNLIVNAVEAIEGNGKVIVTYTGLVLKVEDTGPGIPFCKECSNHQCIPCPKFSSGKTTKSTGNGLGVAFVKSFCKENNFNFRVMSRAKSLTTFSIEFFPEG